MAARVPPKILSSPAWERQHGESPQHYTRFRAFLELGPARTLIKAAERLNIKAATMRKPYVDWQWELRASAYERHARKEADEVYRANVKAAAARHAQMAAAHMTVLMQPIQEVSRRIKAATDPNAAANGVTPINWRAIEDRELLKFAQQSGAALKALVEVERLSLGMHTDHKLAAEADKATTRTVTEAVQDMFSEVEREENAAATPLTPSGEVDARAWLHARKAASEG